MTKRVNSHGFTIIELLVSTVIFSLILLILTAAIIQLSSIYYRGVVNARTQEVSRSIVDEISRQIQYSKNDPTNVSGIPGGVTARCVGGVLYKYKTMQQVDSSSTDPLKHALVSNSSCTGPTLSSLFVPTAGDKELLGDNMHLRTLNIPPPLPYTVSIAIGYGNPGTPALYNNGDFTGSPPNNTCRFTIKQGGQFCSAAQYSTTVTKRR